MIPRDPTFPPSNVSSYEASLDRLLRVHPCQDGEMMSYDLQQAFRSLAFTVVDKSTQYPLRSSFASSSLLHTASPVLPRQKESTDHGTVSPSSSIAFNKKNLVFGREALWYGMCIQATRSVENLQTLIYLSAKLLCEEGSQYGEGNEKPYAGDAWALALISYGLSDRHPALKSKPFYEMERVDRRYLLGHCWLSLGTLRFLTSIPNEQTKKESLHASAALDASHHCWFKRVSEHYPALLESWLTGLIPKIAEVAEGGGAAAMRSTSSSVFGSSVSSTPVAAHVYASPTPRAADTLASPLFPSPPSRPSALMGDANHFIIQSFYYLTSDLLATHRPSPSTSFISSHGATSRILDREAPQCLWTVVDVLRRALERSCTWLEEEMKYWRAEWKGSKKNETKRQKKLKTIQRKASSSQGSSSFPSKGSEDEGEEEEERSRTASTYTAVDPWRRIEVFDQTLLVQVRLHTGEVLSSMVRRQSELHCLRERMKEQYGDSAKDYHYLSELMWEHTLQLCVVIRSLTESYMRALGGLGIFSSVAISAGRRSVGFHSTPTHLLEYIASCVAMLPSVELEEEKPQNWKVEETLKKEGSPPEGEEKRGTGDAAQEDEDTKAAVSVVDTVLTEREKNRTEEVVEREKEQIQQDWKNFTAELMLLSAASAVAYACPLRDMQQDLWSSNMELTKQIQSLITHRCLRRGGGVSGDKREGEAHRHHAAIHNRISHLGAQLLRSIWSFSLDPSNESSESQEGHFMGNKVAALDFLAGTSEQLLDMLKTPSLLSTSSSSGAAEASLNFHRDPTALCVIELLSRATLERPHYLIPALFRLLEHGNKETRRNVLEVLSHLPQIPLGSTSGYIREDRLKREMESEEENEEEVDDPKWNGKEGLDNVSGERANATEGALSDAKYHHLMVRQRERRQREYKAERLRQVMSTLAQHLLLHLHDEELCLRMQSAHLFSRISPEDVLEPLMNLCLQSDSTGRRYSSATTALKALVEAHAYDAKILLDIAEYCYEKGEWYPLHAKQGAAHFPSLPQETEDTRKDSLTDNAGRMRHAKFQTPGDVLPNALLYATENTNWLHASLSSSTGETAQTSAHAASTPTPGPSPTTVASSSSLLLGKQERLSTLFQLLSRHWVHAVKTWDSERHITPLLVYALAVSSNDFSKQQWVVKHFLEVLQWTMERPMSSSSASPNSGFFVQSALDLAMPKEEYDGLHPAMTAVMGALLPYFEEDPCASASHGDDPSSDLQAKDEERDKTLYFTGALSHAMPSPCSSGVQEMHETSRTVTGDAAYTVPCAPKWESQWLRAWRTCLVPYSTSPLDRPLPPPPTFYANAFPLLCIRRCFTALGKCMDAHPGFVSLLFSYLCRPFPRGGEGLGKGTSQPICETSSPKRFSSSPRRGGLWESLWLVLTHSAYRGCAKRVPEFVAVELEIFSQYPPSWFLERWKTDMISLLSKGAMQIGEEKEEVGQTSVLLPFDGVPSSFSTSSGAKTKERDSEEAITEVGLQLLHYCWLYIAFFTRLVVQFQRHILPDDNEEGTGMPFGSSEEENDHPTSKRSKMLSHSDQKDRPLSPTCTDWIQDWSRLALFMVVHLLFPWLEDTEDNEDAHKSKDRRTFHATTRVRLQQFATTLLTFTLKDSGLEKKEEGNGFRLPTEASFPLEILKTRAEATNVLRRLSLSICELFAGLMVRMLMVPCTTTSMTVSRRVDLSRTVRKEETRDPSLLPLVIEVMSHEKNDPSPTTHVEPLASSSLMPVSTEVKRDHCETANRQAAVEHRTLNSMAAATPPFSIFASLPLTSLLALPWVEMVKGVTIEPIQQMGAAYRASTASLRAGRSTFGTATISISLFLSVPHLMESFMLACRIHDGFMQHFSMLHAESSVPLIGRYMQCLVPLYIETANAAAEWGQYSISSAALVHPHAKEKDTSAEGMTEHMEQDTSWIAVAEQCGKLLFQTLMLSSRLPKEVVEAYSRTALGLKKSVIVEEGKAETEMAVDLVKDSVPKEHLFASSFPTLSSTEQEIRKEQERRWQQELKTTFPSFAERVANTPTTEGIQSTLLGDASSSGAPAPPQTLAELLGETFLLPVASFALGCLRYQATSSFSASPLTTSLFQDIGIKIFSALLGTAPEVIVLLEKGDIVVSAVELLRRIAQMHPTPATRKLAEHVVSLFPEEMVHKSNRDFPSIRRSCL